MYNYFWPNIVTTVWKTIEHKFCQKVDFVNRTRIIKFLVHKNCIQLLLAEHCHYNTKNYSIHKFYQKVKLLWDDFTRCTILLRFLNSFRKTVSKTDEIINNFLFYIINILTSKKFSS